MIIIFSDDESRLTDEIRELMQQAGDAAVRSEFGEVLSEDGTAPYGSEDVEVSVTVVSGEEIRELNRDYRGIDRVTDVLSFPQYADRDELAEALSELAEEYPYDYGDEDQADSTCLNKDEDLTDHASVLAGDVVLCYDRAVEQAEEYGTGITRELVYLFVHSIFHLFGYDHEDEDQRREMRTREEQVLSSIGITRDN